MSLEFGFMMEKAPAPKADASLLTQIMAQEIEKAQGFISFHRFMQLALYHPQFGYYAGRFPTGRAGDFITSVSVGPLLGQLLARYFKQAWTLLDQPTPFYIMEQGAMDAQLAVDILSYLRENEPVFFKSIHYLIIEPFPENQRVQREKLETANLANCVEWKSMLHEIAPDPDTGIFFSNELVDSFPVHRVIFRENEWQELGVTWKEETFQWQSQEIKNPQLQSAIKTLPLPAIPGYTTEINLATAPWMKEVSSTLKRGFVLTIDYGHEEALYYAPERVEGTLQSYQNHRRANPLQFPGAQDITAHVNFTELIRAGEQNGLRTIHLEDQHHFLIKIAAPLLEKNEFFLPQNHPQFSATLRAWKTLTHPEMMGTRFKYLLQEK